MVHHHLSNDAINHPCTSAAQWRCLVWNQFSIDYNWQWRSKSGVGHQSPAEHQASLSSNDQVYKWLYIRAEKRDRLRTKQASCMRHISHNSPLGRTINTNSDPRTWRRFRQVCTTWTRVK